LVNSFDGGRKLDIQIFRSNILCQPQTTPFNNE